VGAVEMLRGQLLQDAAEAPQIYGELARSQLFERVCDRFSAEMQEEPVLRDLLQIQLLAQIRAEMPTAAELAAALKEPLATIQQKLQKIENILDPPVQVWVRGRNFPKNPFQPLSGGIDDADSDRFLEQPRLMREVFDLLEAKSSVALIGERGMGKSSLLKAIGRVSQDRLQRQAVYINWNLVHNEETFWGIVCNQIRVPVCTNSELVKVIESRRLLLLLDEVEKMERQVFGEEIRTQLRGFANSDQMKVVVAACVPLDVLFPGEAHSLISLFNNLCLEAKMPPWNLSMVKSYIDRCLRNTLVRFTPQEIQELFWKSQGNPQVLVKSCYELYLEYRNHYETR
jgi:energy-coupling factor transporter ATP-binding protein EcfA2